MTVALAADVEAFLEEQVRGGACADASQFVNDVLRSVRDSQHGSLEVTAELEAWLLAAADASMTPLTKEDFAAIRQRVRGRSVKASS